METMELIPVQGNISCKDAVDKAGQVCNLNPGPRISKNYVKNRNLNGKASHSGICHVGEVKIFIEENEDPDQYLQYRFCDSKDNFLEAGFFTVDAPINSFNLCKTDLCNNAARVKLPTVTYFLGICIYYFTTC